MAEKPDLPALLQAVARWASTRQEVRAVALVGSHARGRARPNSDVDLVVLADGPGRLLAGRGWLGEFGVVETVAEEDWGAVVSLRTRYRGGPDIEWGLAAPSWASVRPVDPGTARVAAGGLRVVYDPDGLLARLVEAAGTEPASRCRLRRFGRG